MRVLLAGLVAFLLLPSVHAGPAAVPGITNPVASTPTHLYFHLFGGQDFPVNTQRPQPDLLRRPFPVGLATNSLGCVPATGQTTVDVLTQKEYTTYYGYSSPSYVDYNYTENGGPRIFPERGLPDDVQLDPKVLPSVDWYITTFTGIQGDGTFHADPVIPRVVAKVTIRTGERITLGDEGYDSGNLIAQGQTDPTTLLAGKGAVGSDGQPNPQVTVDVPGAGQPAIYGFHVPLAYSSLKIPKGAGFAIRIDLFVSLPDCDKADSGYAMPNNVVPFQDNAHLAGMHLATLDPLWIGAVQTRFLGDDVEMLVSTISAWGNYDIDESNLHLDLVGQDGKVVDSVILAKVVQRWREWDHHRDPVLATWVWPYADKGASGTYTATIHIANDQHTANATAVTTFEVGKQLWATSCTGGNATAAGSCERQLQDGDGHVLHPRAAPAPALGFLLGGLLLVALARRKQ